MLGSRPSLLRMATAVGAVPLLIATSTFSAAAQQPVQPPTLEGETLVAFPGSRFEGECDPNATSTFSVRVSGVAVGPYPGTFEETVTVTVGPQTGPPIPIFSSSFLAFNSGAATATARFTIFSGETVVRGTKEFTVGNAVCADLEGVDVPPFFDITSGETHQFMGSGSYEAVIQTPDGSFTDSGTASADWMYTVIKGSLCEDLETLCGAATVVELFEEVFTVSNGLVPSTPGHVTGGGHVLNATELSEVTFAFEAKSEVDGTTGRRRLEGHCDVVDQATDTHVKCVDVAWLAQTPTHATFYGNAVVNGVATRYRIDIDDLSESGAGRDTFKIQTDTGYTAGGVLTEGNVQIHPVELDRR